MSAAATIDRGTRRGAIRRPWLLLLAVIALVSCGCAGTTNPSFDLSPAEARGVLRQMARQPVALERPVVVLAGYLDPGFASTGIANELRRATDGGPVITVTFLAAADFEDCRERVREAIRLALPETTEPGATVEIDAIGVSMGGLVARSIAREVVAADRRGPDVRIRRLYTIATPHRGAGLAILPTLDPRVADMRPGSDFLASLDGPPAHERRHGPGLEDEPEIVAYARLGDVIVGEERTGYGDEPPIWVPTPPFSFAHLQAASDPRILADIFRRLRGEPPLADEPRAPLPD